MPFLSRIPFVCAGVYHAMAHAVRVQEALLQRAQARVFQPLPDAHFSPRAPALFDVDTAVGDLILLYLTFLA